MFKKILLLLCALNVINGYRIMLAFPMPGKSHSLLGEGLVRHLLRDGHEVTLITPFPPKGQTNLTVIDVSSNLEHKKRNNFENMIERVRTNEVSMSQELVMDVMHLYARAALLHENTQAILTDPNVQFDLVIAEWMFSEVYAGLPTLYRCPFIWYHSMDPDWMVLQLIEGQSNPSITSSIFSTASTPFTFWERGQELWLRIKGLYYKNLLANIQDKQSYDEIFVPLSKLRGVPFVPYEEAKYNASLLLGNSHISFSSIPSLPENYKLIGGSHIEEQTKPLPQDLQKIMDNAKNGVIYFSMGTNLNSESMPAVKDDLLKVFGSVKQTVLWKYDGEVTDLPKNVHALKWAPQTSILAHPNCVLFITHGGFLSTIESVHYGVPTIGMPVFGDQYWNVEKATKKGYALKVEWTLDVATTLKSAVEEITVNPKYMKRAKELSRIYHDRPISPGKEAIHWIKHVISTKGALHLRSAAVMIPWYQKMYLDWLALVSVILIAITKILSVLYSVIFKSGKSVSKSKKNK